MAALIAIPYSYVAPDSYVDTNIKGTLNICQAALENGVKRVIHTSTSEVYGTAQYVPIDERHPLQAQSPYSASKIGADAMAMSFFNAFNLPVTIARPFNTYGPRQSARAVIPTIITQIANGKKQIKLGDVTPTRDFNYVADTCRGFLELARCDKAIGETVNIGSNFEISVGDTLNMIKELMGSDVKFLTDMISACASSWSGQIPKRLNSAVLHSPQPFIVFSVNDMRSTATRAEVDDSMLSIEGRGNEPSPPHLPRDSTIGRYARPSDWAFVPVLSTPAKKRVATSCSSMCSIVQWLPRANPKTSFMTDVACLAPSCWKELR